MTIPTQIIITTHALYRWRFRSAEYGDAPRDEVVRALCESRKIGPKDLLPFGRIAGMLYFLHEETSTYFVAQQEGGVLRVVTAIVRGQPFAYTAASAGKETNGKARKKGGYAPAVKCPAVTSLATTDDQEPKFDHVKDEYFWLVNRVGEMENTISRLPKAERRRSPLAPKIGRLRGRIIAIKPAYLKWRNEQSRIGLDGVREDGSVDFTAAIKFLIKRVEELQAEVNSLKNAREMMV